MIEEIDKKNEILELEKIREDKKHSALEIIQTNVAKAFSFSSSLYDIDKFVRTKSLKNSQDQKFFFQDLLNIMNNIKNNEKQRKNYISIAKALSLDLINAHKANVNNIETTMNLKEINRLKKLKSNLKTRIELIMKDITESRYTFLFHNLSTNEDEIEISVIENLVKFVTNKEKTDPCTVEKIMISFDSFYNVLSNLNYQDVQESIALKVNEYANSIIEKFDKLRDREKSKYKHLLPFNFWVLETSKLSLICNQLEKIYENQNNSKDAIHNEKSKIDLVNALVNEDEIKKFEQKNLAPSIELSLKKIIEDHSLNINSIAESLDIIELESLDSLNEKLKNYNIKIHNLYAEYFNNDLNKNKGKHRSHEVRTDIIDIDKQCKSTCCKLFSGYKFL